MLLSINFCEVEAIAQKLLLSRRNFGIWFIQSDLLEGDAPPSPQYQSEFGFYELKRSILDSTKGF